MGDRTNQIQRSNRVIRAAARALRRAQTPAETALWRALRDRRMDGFKFRRQCPVGPFVLDFCCRELKLAIELDGAVHGALVERDRERTEFLEAGGYRVIRFRNEEILHDLVRVVKEIGRVARDIQSA